MASSATDIASAIRLAAAEFAERLSRAAQQARTEADIRSAADRELSRFENALGIQLTGRHEFTVASGRVDSVYDRVIIEYKNPASPSDRIGAQLDSSGTRRLVDQIKSRFSDLKLNLATRLNRSSVSAPTA